MFARRNRLDSDESPTKRLASAYAVSKGFLAACKARRSPHPVFADLFWVVAHAVGIPICSMVLMIVWINGGNSPRLLWGGGGGGVTVREDAGVFSAYACATVQRCVVLLPPAG